MRDIQRRIFPKPWAAPERNAMIKRLAADEFRRRSEVDDYGILLHPPAGMPPIPDIHLHDVKMDVRFMVPRYLDDELQSIMSFAWDALFLKKGRWSYVKTATQKLASEIFNHEKYTPQRLNAENTIGVPEAAASMLVDAVFTCLGLYHSPLRRRALINHTQFQSSETWLRTRYDEDIQSRANGVGFLYPHEEVIHCLNVVIRRMKRGGLKASRRKIDSAYQRKGLEAAGVLNLESLTQAFSMTRQRFENEYPSILDGIVSEMKEKRI